MAVVVDIRGVTGHRSHGTVCTSVLGSRFSTILVQQEIYCFNVFFAGDAQLFVL